jgi:diacylglycerol kinase (ATP)
MSFVYAFRGLALLFRTETNAQIHLSLLLLVTLAGWYFSVSTSEWLAILLCFGLVIGLEAVNTALEKLTDLVSPQRHPLAGQAKDIAAGAVLWAAILAVIIGLVIFVPKVIAL